MDRNFFRRVEIAVPIINTKLKRRVFREGLSVHFTEGSNNWKMRKDGSYVTRRQVNDINLSSQERLLKQFSS